MTTHFKCASNWQCIDLFLFVRFFWCFRFFCYCIFLFVLLLEQGYFNVTLLPMQSMGWEYPPPATANNCCRGHRSRCDTATTATCSCTTGTAAAVHDAVEHAATGTCRAHYCFRCACYALVVCASCLVVRTTHVLIAHALSYFPQTLSKQLTQLSPTQPLWPAPQSPLRAASQQLSPMLFPGESPTLGSAVRGSLPVGQVQQVLFGPLPVQQQQQMQQQQVQAAAQQVGSPEQQQQQQQQQVQPRQQQPQVQAQFQSPPPGPRKGFAFSSDFKNRIWPNQNSTICAQGPNWTWLKDVTLAYCKVFVQSIFSLFSVQNPDICTPTENHDPSTVLDSVGISGSGISVVLHSWCSHHFLYNQTEFGSATASPEIARAHPEIADF